MEEGGADEKRREELPLTHAIAGEADDAGCTQSVLSVSKQCKPFCRARMMQGCCAWELSERWELMSSCACSLCGQRLSSARPPIQHRWMCVRCERPLEVVSLAGPCIAQEAWRRAAPHS